MRALASPPKNALNSILCRLCDRLQLLWVPAATHLLPSQVAYLIYGATRRRAFGGGVALGVGWGGVGRPPSPLPTRTPGGGGGGRRRRTARTSPRYNVMLAAPVGRIALLELALHATDAHALFALQVLGALAPRLSVAIEAYLDSILVCATHARWTHAYAAVARVIVRVDDCVKSVDPALCGARRHQCE